MMAIAKKYGWRSLLLMLLKSYHHFHPLSKVDRSLDIVEMVIVNTSEPIKKFVNKSLLIF
jgi:hypothetical protein